jgi:hypothetical protein
MYLETCSHRNSKRGTAAAAAVAAAAAAAGIAVRDLPGEIDMEVDVRWCGDANISIAIDLPVGG